jgi:hypothetical protein
MGPKGGLTRRPNMTAETGKREIEGERLFGTAKLESGKGR